MLYTANACSIFEQSAGIVGFVILFHNNILKVTCPICVSFWIAVVQGVMLCDIDTGLDRIGLTALLCYLAVYYMPELFTKSQS